MKKVGEIIIQGGDYISLRRAKKHEGKLWKTVKVLEVKDSGELITDKGTVKAKQVKNFVLPFDLE